MKHLLTTLIFSLLVVVARAESEPLPPTKLDEVVENAPRSSAEVLEGIMRQIESIKVSLKGNLQEQNAAELEATLSRLRKEFDELLAGKESVAYFQQDPNPASIQEELLEIFDPLIGEIKNATASSREKEELRNQIELLTLKKAAIDSALERVSAVKGSEEALSSGLSSVISREESLWKERQQQTQLELESAKLQLNTKASGSKNAVESASKVITKFIKTRGVHLIAALVCALLAFLIITFGYRLFTKFSPIHKKEELYSTSKTMDGVIHLSSLLVSLIAFILTLFLCDDWVLLTAFLLLFSGIFWALRDKFADIAEEVRLILNIGSVREGERIHFQGLSWRVEKIRIYSQLTNPQLEGGMLRIPVNALVGLHSRPCKGTENYFPSSVNDWVLLEDETFGKVLHQSPDYVELVQLGGSRKTYKTETFLNLTPENLSGVSFRIKSTFGIDYKHQSTITDEIPKLLQSEIKAGLIDFLGNEHYLKRVNVEFSSAAASSLDFDILADFSSEVAPKYNILTRLIQRLSVDACNKHDWEIPFTQITMHQA